MGARRDDRIGPAADDHSHELAESGLLRRADLQDPAAEKAGKGTWENAPQLEKQFLFRFAVPQGITGPWQVNGHYAVTIDDQLKAERDYVGAWSLRRDVAILLRTIPLVLRKAGI